MFILTSFIHVLPELSKGLFPKPHIYYINVKKKYISINIYKYISINIYKCISINIYKYIQICKYIYKDKYIKIYKYICVIDYTYNMYDNI
jgi:hypothetical protein